jgi:hypothetical protein
VGATERQVMVFRSGLPLEQLAARAGVEYTDYP